jgi:hypothetical protein
MIRSTLGNSIGLLFSRRDSILDPLVRFGVCDLLLARVRRDDTIENCHKSYGCLAAASSAIPRELPRGCDAGKVFEHFPRVTRPKFCVIRRLFRKMIFEGHTTFPLVAPAASAAIIRRWMLGVGRLPHSFAGSGIVLNPTRARYSSACNKSVPARSMIFSKLSIDETSSSCSVRNHWRKLIVM